MQAHLQGVNLSATSFYYPHNDTKSYLNYGVAVSEVVLFLIQKVIFSITHENGHLALTFICCGQSHTIASYYQ